MNQSKIYIRLLVAMVAILLAQLPSWALLPENSVDKSVRLLSKELDGISRDLDKERAQYDYRRNDYWKDISKLEEKIAISNLVQLSQGLDNPLGMAKASQLSHDLLDELARYRRPIMGWIEGIDDNIARASGIKAELLKIDTLRLTDQGRLSLRQAIAKCDSIERFYSAYRQSLAPDIERYKRLECDVAQLAQTNQELIRKLHRSIFVNGNETFPEFLEVYMQVPSDKSADPAEADTAASDIDSSEWKSTPQIVDEIDGWSTLSSIIIALALFIGITYFKRKDKQSLIYRKRGPLAVLLICVLNIVIGVLILFFIDAPLHVYRDIEFNMQFNIVVVLIILIHLIRRNQYKLRYVFFAYLPIMLLDMGVFNLINEIETIQTIMVMLPSMLFLFIPIQVVINIVLRKKLAKVDKVTANINLCMMAVCLIVTWSGWSIISIMLVLSYFALWGCWLVFRLLQYWVFARLSDDRRPLARYTMRALGYPLLSLSAIVACTFWVADIFSLNTWLMQWLDTPFVNLPDVCVISLSHLIILTAAGIVVNYLVGLAKRVFLSGGSPLRATGKAAVTVSLCSIMAWLAFAIAVIVLLKINHTGIIAAIGGASVGLGFAMRDTIENFFYGITMMTGRARPGDIVECDGIRGYVRQVGVISTSLETEDGPIVSLPNSQLFGRNFKNLTINDSRELRHISIDIDDSNDIDLARRLMLESVEEIDGVIPDADHYVVMRNCGSGVVRMEIKVWIDTRKYLRAEPAVREAIFHAFRANGIKVADMLKNIEVRSTNGLMTNSSII